MSTEPEPNPVDRPEGTPRNPVPPGDLAPPPAEPVVSQPAAPAGGVPKAQADKKIVSGILGILLGWIGVHKFYLGYQKEGIIMLVVGLVGLFICGIPTTVVGIIGIIEGILYLTKTDEEFVSTYVTGRRSWF